MSARRLGHTQSVAAAKAGFSERTGRHLGKQGSLPSQRPRKHWRRRKEVFSEVWEGMIVPLLQGKEQLTAVSILEHLQDVYPGEYSERHLRTLQRRIQKWRALHGPARDIIFRQEHLPGLQGLSDFTHPREFGITVQGKPLTHLLYHFRLAYSCWSFMRVVQGGESLMALTSGLQDALWHLGGCPREHCTESLSAAFKNLSREESQDMTTQYEELCRHYGMSATRNNRGQSHENGSVEGPHGHLKRRLKDALVLKGSRDFPSLGAYQEFIDTVVRQHNQRHQKLIEEEHRHLRPLPAFRTCDFKEVTARVTTSSTIVVQKVIYSVPSRLIGQQLRINVYENRLSCYIGNDHVLDLPRLRTQQGKSLNFPVFSSASGFASHACLSRDLVSDRSEVYSPSCLQTDGRDFKMCGGLRL